MTLRTSRDKPQGKSPLCADPDCCLPFDRLTKRQTFCSRPECRQHRSNKRTAKWRPPKPTHYVCEFCKVERIHTIRGRHPRFCGRTPACAEAKEKHKGRHRLEQKPVKIKPRMWPCKRCGRMSHNRINCPTCLTELSDQVAEINGRLPS